MTRAPWMVLASLALLVAVACDNGGTTTPTAEPSAVEAEASASAEPEASASAEPSAEPDPSAEASAEASAEPTATAKANPNPKAAPTAAASAAGSAKSGKEKFACGNKGQKLCPMQGWMKGVMARAMASGDKDKIAKALDTIASKPVAGFGQWSSIAAEGAAQARAGNIDGAKASCKKCHSLYQKKYENTMRDQPW